MFKLLIYQPLFNLLILFYNLFHSLGISVIALTALVRLLLWPMFNKNEVSQKAMSKIQPEVKRIQKEYAKDYQKQSQELLTLYKQYKINPGFTIIFSIIQLFIILALYNVFVIVSKPTFTHYLYQPFQNITSINYLFLNTVNLQQGNLWLAIIAALVQLAQGFIMFRNTNPHDPQRNSLLMITIIMPIILVSLYKQLPSIIFLYWIVLSIIGVIQSLYIQKHLKLPTPNINNEKLNQTT